MEKFGFGKKDRQEPVFSKQKQIIFLEKEQDLIFTEMKKLLEENNEGIINSEELEQLEYRCGYIGEKIFKLKKELKIEMN